MHTSECVTGRGHHCGACHVTFGTLSLFDAHRSGDVDHRRCQQPGQAKGPSPALPMLRKDQFGVWQTPEGLEARTARSTRAQKARSTP